MSEMELDRETIKEIPELSNVMLDGDLGRVVRIRWIDSGMSLPHRWLTREQAMTKMETMESAPVETVGLWMGENDYVVMVGQSRDRTNDNWMAAQLIWKQCITEKEFLS